MYIAGKNKTKQTTTDTAILAGTGNNTQPKGNTTKRNDKASRSLNRCGDIVLSCATKIARILTPNLACFAHFAHVEKNNKCKGVKNAIFY